MSLYDSQSDCVFIRTMGFDVATFHGILDAGFVTEWNTQPVPCNNVPQTGVPQSTHRSLDAAGALGLALHFLMSTMADISLMQIFVFIPTMVLRFIQFPSPFFFKPCKEYLMLEYNGFKGRSSKRATI